MDQLDMRELLEKVRAGRLSVPRALERLRHLPFEDLGFAKIDHHRGVRQGFAEVVYARGKTPRQVSAIVSR
ncbi:MAG TPA: 1-(5-phosphoribosyl)-5-amino-4-imidazole-carboxylate carboxylase, partial [Steroidobacteraceae bacterium]|nr:1-(5-phosphoribosyl)-5-amino-4-imidazole-carboxylate carboxylase [Steroidobacteraceae bacterium]